MGFFDLFKSENKVSRRDFLKQVLAGASTFTVMPTMSSQTQVSPQQAAKEIRESQFYDSSLQSMDRKSVVKELNQIPIQNAARDSVEENIKIETGLEEENKFQEEAYAIEFKATNQTSNNFIVQLTTVIPNGWAFYGFKNVSSATGGVATSVFELEPGESEVFISLVFNSGTGGRTAELLSSYAPVNNKSKARRSETEIRLP